jgi:hypothetical protein
MLFDRNRLMSRISWIAIFCAALLQPATGLRAAQERTGPLTLVINYRCAAVNRPSFRNSIVKVDVPRFERWKTEGVLQGYNLLFNWYVDENTWDLMAVFTFHTYADVQRWRDIQRISPGGLSPESLRLGVPTNTYSADLNWHGTAPDARTHSIKSVFFVIPYDVVNMDEYKPYVSGYVVPQIDGWIREGVLVSYNLYLNRYYAGRPWDSLLILEYKDLESFGQRESVIAKVRAALSADPKWKALSENKKSLRTEKETVLAEDLSRR